jgi:hypothetical protein
MRSTRYERGTVSARAASLLVAVALLLGAVLVACGDEDSPEAGAGGASPSPTPRNQGALSFVTRPDLHPASITVTTDTGAASPGYVFVTPGSRRYGDTGPMIVDSAGDPVWVGTAPEGENATTFQAQTYRGRPVLTWWEGPVQKPGFGEGVAYIVDQSYRTIATVRAGNGLEADLHDFVITEDDTALLVIYQKVTRDLSPLGGSQEGEVLNSLIQEVDIATGRVLLQWDPLDDVPMSEAYKEPKEGELFDPYHLNSVGVDADGDLLVSARHTWAVYKIDRQTGDLLWTLGGKGSDLAMGDGAQFAWQHDARRLTDGTLGIFDNQAASEDLEEADVSRGLALDVDETAMTADVAWEISHEGVLARSQGNMQPLPDGGVFVGWGSEPNLSEYAADGTLVWDAVFYETNQSYRGFKYEWAGRPLAPPDLVVQDGGAGLVAYMSWNGATEAASWEVLAGTDRGSLEVVATAPREGFETVVPVGEGSFFQVRALSADGERLGVSRIVRATPVTASPSPSPSPATSP